MSKNLVSVVMSAFNSETTIEKSLVSLLNQTYSEIEILVIDDNSTDNTFEICSDLSKKHENLKIFRNRNNLGLTKNLNTLINKSNGDFIARQDADDISISNRLDMQLKYLNKYDLDGCATRAYIMGKNKIIPGKSYYLPKKIVMKKKNPFIHGTLLIKSSVIKEVGLYNEKFYYSQDYKLMSDLLKNNYKLKIMKEPLYHLNMEGNISIKYKKEQEYYANCVKKDINP